MNIEQLLKKAIELNASDLHLTSNMPPWMRIDGELRMVDMPSIADKDLEQTLLDCMTENSRKTYEQRLEIDFAYFVAEGVRFRVNVFKHDGGIGAAFRTIPVVIPKLDELEMPDILTDIAMSPRGLVLVTGPTGCGKSTTLASIIDYINNNRHDHIVTIEDPIEYMHSSKGCLINQRELHKDTTSFNIALRSALREDPDIILVGEMRDLETIRLVLTAAETGHLVFATLHTLSAVKSIARIIDVFPGDERTLVRTMLAGSLRAVLSQVLVKRANGGRIAATELMICTEAISNLIREHKLEQAYSTVQTSSEQGMYTLDQNLQFLLSEGVIKRETALAVAQDRTNFAD